VSSNSQKSIGVKGKRKESTQALQEKSNRIKPEKGEGEDQGFPEEGSEVGKKLSRNRTDLLPLSSLVMALIGGSGIH